jgi:hypothetical protein
MSVKRNTKHKIETYLDLDEFEDYVSYCCSTMGPVGKRTGWWYRKREFDKNRMNIKFTKNGPVRARGYTFLFKDEQDALAFKLSRGIL